MVDRENSRGRGARALARIFFAAGLLSFLLFPLAVRSAEKGFVRGDSNADGEVDISDAVAVLYHLFVGRDLPCLDAADVDSSGSLEITDPICLLGFLFLGEPAPGSPFPACGLAGDDIKSVGCAAPYCEVAGLVPDGVWMGKPDGCMQCVRCDATLPGVLAELETLGVTPFEAREGWPFAVCAACGCPAGRYFFVLVNSGDVPPLEATGWRPMDPETR